MDKRAESREEPGAGRTAVLGSLPFFAYGLMSVALHFGGDWLPATLLLHPIVLFGAFVLAGLGAGVLAGWPRWSYAYLFWALILAWWLDGLSMNGVRISGLTFLGPLGVIGLGLLLRRSFAPLRRLFAGLGRDWTLFSLGIYCFFAWLSLLYDENHHPYLLPFIAASTAAACAGAAFYFRQSDPWRRVLALGASMLALAAIEIVTSATWDARAYYNLPESVSAINPIYVSTVFVMLLLMLLTGYVTQRWVRG